MKNILKKMTGDIMRIKDGNKNNNTLKTNYDAGFGVHNGQCYNKNKDSA